MTFLLSGENVFDYLIERGLCESEVKSLGKIEPKIAKNFNLLINLSDEEQILVKQEPHNRSGETAGEFAREWRIRQFIQQFSELDSWRTWLPEVIDFDLANSIMAITYYQDHQNLADFYSQENIFPEQIAKTIGSMVATIHRTTFKRQEYQDFFAQATDTSNYFPDLLKGLERISPEIFGQVPSDGLKFLTLYQRYESLGKAIALLQKSLQPCCLVHNDLKLNNLLLPLDWEQTDSIELKLIDWERSSWGDPAFDLGMLVSSYLSCWLGSLVVSKTLAIEESLRLAMTPLELLQPSLVNLLTTYLTNFPQILEQQPDFPRRVMQFAGLALIHTIQSLLQYQKSFNNTGICMLQVAKTLLCRPEISMQTIFGKSEAELISLSKSIN
ncbi:phosphotransferase [Pleurocapsales cyanobacterium LEGE 06147]|nr:phosphotransferase [Pleurocapsales cyanobacterium LEGE 06147]